MQKLILMGLFLTILVAPTTFADDELSPFNQQSDLDYQQAKPEDSYFAVRAPETSTLQRYFGMNMGATITNLKPKITKDGTLETIKNTAISYLIGGYGGLGTNFDRFYIGTELSINYNTLSKSLITSTTSGSTKLSINQPLTAGLDLIPGYLTQQKDMLFYGRLGVGTSLFKFKLNDEADSSAKKLALGWRAGLGVEYLISDSFSINIDYIFTNYGNIKKDYTSKTSGSVYSYEIPSPNSNQVSLGFAINF